MFDNLIFVIIYNWSPYELGYSGVSLGGRILRADLIAAVSINILLICIIYYCVKARVGDDHVYKILGWKTERKRPLGYLDADWRWY
jgi:uncharacterized membrane protein